MPIHVMDQRAQVDLGFGDVRIAPALTETKNEEEQPLGAVVFFPSFPEDIGTVRNYGEPMYANDVDSPLRIVFHKVESIDVMIRALELAKAMMLSGELEAGFNEGSK